MWRQVSGLIVSVVAVTAASSAHAADLDGAFPRPRVIAGIGPDAVVAPQALPRCRTIAAPEFNLSYEVARFRPQTICYSRGLLADQMNP